MNTPNDSFSLRHGVRLTRQTLPHQIIKRLSELYDESYHDSAVDDFLKSHFEPMLADSTLDATAMEQLIYDGMNGKDVELIDLLRQSCAYCVCAIRAEKQGELDTAWMYASFAQYWLGISNGIRFVSGAGELALSLRGKKGGKKSSEARHGEAIKFSRELAHQHINGSRTAAARAIKAQVIDFLKKSEKKHYALSEHNAERTIYGWLFDIPFEGKRGPRKPNVKG